MFVILECIYWWYYVAKQQCYRNAHISEQHSQIFRYSCIELEGFELHLTMYSYCVYMQMFGEVSMSV